MCNKTAGDKMICPTQNFIPKYDFKLDNETHFYAES
jgi:hypothetical protein